MADNRIDFMYGGEKYFAELIKPVDLAHSDPKRDKGIVVVVDLSTLPKGFDLDSMKISDSHLSSDAFPLNPPEGFVYIIGKYPKE